MKLTKYILLTSCALLLQACNSETPPVSQPATVISSHEITGSADNQFRDFNGQVVPAELTPIAFRISGELQEIVVKAGEKIEKGQLIAKLDSRKVRQQLNDAQAKFSLAERQRNRADGLTERNMISPAEFDELSANVQLAEINLKIIQKNLQYTKLYAPFSGVISEVHKKSFESLSVGEPVLELYRDELVYVKIQLPDNIIYQLEASQDSKEYRPDVRFSGMQKSYSMRHLEYSYDPVFESKTLDMWLSMPQVKENIQPGESATVRVDLKRIGLTDGSGYFVPINTLDAGVADGEFYVWKVQDNKVFRSPVTVLQVTAQGAFVSAGVKQGDRLATSNLRQLREGKKVNIAKEVKGL